MSFIVKMQRSVAPTNDVVLVYNEKKTIMAEQPLTPELTKLFNGQLKVYARARLRKGELEIQGLVKPQAW